TVSNVCASQEEVGSQDTKVEELVNSVCGTRCVSPLSPADDVEEVETCQPEQRCDGQAALQVSNAQTILSRTTASGFLFMVENYGLSKEILTTAWFLEQANVWFEFVSSTHPTMALSLSCKDKYSETIRFLKKFIDMFQSLKIDSGTFKPVRAGVILSTLSIVYLQDFLLNEDKYSFILTSRFTQDSLENFFSAVRRRNPNGVKDYNSLPVPEASVYRFL
ncbi:hypothetical protein MTO96_040653, partial [Rhipicephalus appendiculatus]